MEEFELKKNSICSNIFGSILVRNEKKLAKNIQIERVYINIVFLYRIHVCSLNANVSVDLRSTVKRWRHTNIWKLRCFFWWPYHFIRVCSMHYTSVLFWFQIHMKNSLHVHFEKLTKNERLNFFAHFRYSKGGTLQVEIKINKKEYLKAKWGNDMKETEKNSPFQSKHIFILCMASASFIIKRVANIWNTPSK